MSKNQIVAIITAGGSGKRMKSSTKKQFATLDKIPVLHYSIRTFLSIKQICKLCVVLPVENFLEEKTILNKTFPQIIVVMGGEKRQNSIFNALLEINSADFVLVHDGVRPFVSKKTILAILEDLPSKKAIIPIIKQTSSLKLIDNQKITGSLDRKKVVCASTPQAFEFALLMNLYQRASKSNIHFTDDAGLLEYYSQRVYFVEDNPINIKITTPFDMLLAKFILKNLKQRSKEAFSK